jgi:hypothetical protein
MHRDVLVYLFLLLQLLMKEIVALQSIQITDGQGNDILSVTVKEPGNKVIVSNEGKRPIEFIQVQPLFQRTLHRKNGLKYFSD